MSLEYSSHRVKDLTETIINTGVTYQHRLDIARSEMFTKDYRSCAIMWLAEVTNSAFDYERQFQPSEKFTVAELAETVMHLSTYYAQHLAEFDPADL